VQLVALPDLKSIIFKINDEVENLVKMKADSGPHIFRYETLKFHSLTHNSHIITRESTQGMDEVIENEMPFSVLHLSYLI